MELLKSNVLTVKFVFLTKLNMRKWWESWNWGLKQEKKFRNRKYYRRHESREGLVSIMMTWHLAIVWTLQTLKETLYRLERSRDLHKIFLFQAISNNYASPVTHHLLFHYLLKSLNHSHAQRSLLTGGVLPKTCMVYRLLL